MEYQFLSQDQIDQFVNEGYIILRGAFEREKAREWSEWAFYRLGYDPNDRSTWKEERIHLGSTRFVDTAEFAPKVWAAVCDLLGGEERVQKPYNWSDGFVCNFGVGHDRPWDPPSPAVKGWHKDGDFFRHFLDSPEQGLLTIVLWTEMVSTGGGTFIAPDSVGVVARYMAEHPEGLRPGEAKWGELINECRQFLELTGEPGDVVLHHPYMLHATSQNVLRAPRMISNPPAKLNEPMNFNRENPEDFSPVELGVLRGLGVERYDFQPTHPREKIVPERVRRQQQMLEEERKRLAAQQS